MVALSSSTSLLPLVVLSLVLGAPAQATVGNPATPEVAATPVVGAQAAVPVVITGATANPNLTSVPGTSACPEMAAFGPGGISIQRADYSMARKMSISSTWGNTNTSLGSISSPIYTYASENELRTTTGSLVAKLVSPTVFWDTTADLYDCVDDLFAEIQWSTSNWWTTMFNPNMRVFDIFDASKTKVATMETIKSGTGDYKRSVIALKVGDTIVMQLDMTPYGFTKSVLGLFGHFEKATISFIASPTINMPPLLKDPRFLSLIAAEALSPGNNGPFVTVIFLALPLACIICCVCTFLCKPKGSKGGSTIKPSEVLANADNEEKSRLMGPGEAGKQEAQQNAAKYPPPARSIFSCCSRKPQPASQGMAPV